MHKLYIDSVMLFDRLHRLFLTIVKKELYALSISDLTPTQALILYHISDKTMKIVDITNNKFYLGSNISYNLKQMVANGYVCVKETKLDKRVSYVSLSAKGRQLYERMDEIMQKQEKHSTNLGIEDNDMRILIGCGHNLENVWQRYFFEI